MPRGSTAGARTAWRDSARSATDPSSRARARRTFPPLATGRAEANRSGKDSAMCTHGMNVDQFEQMIDMVDDCTALGYRWAHRMAHVAGDAGRTSASEKLHAAQMLLADARSLFDEAKTCVEEGAVVSSGATAKLV